MIVYIELIVIQKVTTNTVSMIKGISPLKVQKEEFLVQNTQIWMPAIDWDIRDNDK